MAKTEKLLAKLLNLSGSLTWNELIRLLNHFGYTQQEGSGSRVKFDNGDSEMMISLHRPHPGNEVKHYVRKQIIEILQNGGVIE